jgi:phosphatidylserine/phosphatidylglycerophosphate/cardiolipin synthase-like enzyme
MADHLLPGLSSFTFYPKLLAAGVKVWRYQPGFLHQKVLLADEDFAIVGSINLDYRSFMLNPELSAAVQDRAFALDVENMFLADFDRSSPEDLRAFRSRLPPFPPQMPGRRPDEPGAVEAWFCIGVEVGPSWSSV